MTTHVGIVGVPYCGSTILGALLDLHPDLAATGEIDYLVRWTEHEGLSGPPECNRCGKACQVWTEEIRRMPWTWDLLAGDMQIVFPDAAVLVHSCKYPHLYDRMGGVDVALLLVRRPEACALSSHSHLGVDPADYYRSWLKRYREMWEWTRIRSHLVLSYERLMESPILTVRSLWSALSLVAPPEPIDLPKPADLRDHQFAGNGGMRSRPTIELDRRWETADLPPVPAPAIALYELIASRSL